MADLLRKFKSLDIKRKKFPITLLKVIWILSATFTLLVSLSIYKIKKTASPQYSYNKTSQNPNPRTATVTPTPTPLYGTVPEAYVINGGDHSFQTFNNCGPASLSMALSFYGISVSQQTLGNELRPYQIPNGNNDDKSVTLSELAEKSKDFGFIPFHRPIGNIEIIKKFIASDIPVITRTLTKINEDIGHFRVVYGYDDGRLKLIQNDSLQGKGLEYDYDEFLNLWKPYGFEYLVLVRSEQQALVKSIIGENYYELTAWDNAVKYLEKAIEGRPNDIYLQFSLSVAYYNIGSFDKSIELFESVEGKLPFRTLWYQIEPLMAYQKLGRYEELLLRVDKILNNGNRAYSELYQIRGEIYLEQGKVEEAKREFEKAIYYNKNFAPAINSINYLDSL